MLSNALIVATLVLFSAATVSFILAIKIGISLIGNIETSKRLRVNLMPLLALTEWAYADFAKPAYRRFIRCLGLALMLTALAFICALGV